MPGTGPGGGKTANRGRTLGAALEKEERAIYWKGGVKNLKKVGIRAGKVCEQSWGIRDRGPLQGM